ncbi:MAG TPA: outer membrane lipid asymmetry maintenance protein MlaD [Candidatus Saccharimonadia bacterium]|nr:outer membrane lipid asymmetry maintenance protein MlaD [Candidatus Saccharimonadia bacterium]
MKRFNLEVSVGLFVVIGLCALAYLSMRLGQLQLGRGNTYDLIAVFPTVAGLRAGATVEIAGVQVGRVQGIKLADYAAAVTLRIDKQVQLQEDAIASIRTRGLIGEKYVRISPGGSDHVLTAGERMREVEPPIDIETLIGHFIQGKL